MNYANTPTDLSLFVTFGAPHHGMRTTRTFPARQACLPRLRKGRHFSLAVGARLSLRAITHRPFEGDRLRLQSANSWAVLERCTGDGRGRKHDDVIMTLKPSLRWCSESFEMERARVRHLRPPQLRLRIDELTA